MSIAKRLQLGSIGFVVRGKAPFHRPPHSHFQALPVAFFGCDQGVVNDPDPESSLPM